MNYSPLHVIFYIFTFHILQSTTFSTVTYNCKTHEGKFGSCVEIPECPSIKSYIKQSNYVLTPKLRQVLEENTCQYIGQRIKVCCPVTSTFNKLDNYYPKPNSIHYISNDVVHKNAKLLPHKCGMNKNRNAATFETTLNEIVADDEEATLNEFPWMAILSYSTDKGPAYQCVGTIINERYILTAANCIKKELISVRVGEHNTTAIHDCQKDDFNIIKCSPPAEDIAIEKAFRHERFMNSLARNDIGLIRLSKPLNIYTESVRAICLPLQNSLNNKIIAPHSSMLLTGWGFNKKWFINDVLLKGKVSAITSEQCSRFYQSNGLTISGRQFCIAGQHNGKHDLCNGDTGSPVQMLNGLRYTQYGILSVGPKRCATKGNPIINTKVDQYMKWILNNIEP